MMRSDSPKIATKESYLASGVAPLVSHKALIIAKVTLVLRLSVELDASVTPSTAARPFAAPSRSLIRMLS